MDRIWGLADVGVLHGLLRLVKHKTPFVTGRVGGWLKKIENSDCTQQVERASYSHE